MMYIYSVCYIPELNRKETSYYSISSIVLCSVVDLFNIVK